MTKQPLISVPIFTYNGAEFLEQQIESIYAQTYENIEVIACDDGSTDETVNILKKYHNSHNLKYFVHEKNVGVSQNVAKAFSLCTGDFIAPSDQDDIWKPEKLTTLIKHIHNHILIYSLSTPIDINNKILDATFLSREVYIQGKNNLGFLFENCISGHNMMFKKELLKHLKVLPSTIYPDWWIAFVAASYDSIGYFNESLVYYRRHASQITSQSVKQNSNFFSRSFVKDKNKKKTIQDIINRLQSFNNLDILDNKTRQYILDLETEFKKLFNLYYNKQLEQLLESKKEKVFAMYDKNTSRHIKKLARGIWYYRARLYI